MRAWESGLDEPQAVEPRASVADGILVNKPSRGKEILAAIRATRGAALRVDNEAILSAQTMLAQRGIFAEPTSATPVAALRQARADLADTEIVIPITGTGLKSLGK